MKKYIILLLAVIAFSCNNVEKKGGEHTDSHESESAHNHDAHDDHKEKSHSSNEDTHDHAKDAHDHAKEEHNHEEEKHDHAKDEHSNGEHSEHEHAKEEEMHAEGIHLNKAQLKSARVEIKPMKKVTIRDRVEVTGSIEVPPKSKATVYAPMEAFVYKSELLPGDKVRKGQTVAVLQHSSFIELQYKYLDAINKRNVAQDEYQRKKMLFESDITSKKTYLATESAYYSSQSLVDSYSSQLEMMGFSPAKIAGEGIQKYVYVGAPISGYVVENNLNKGKFLTSNEKMLEIIDNSHLHAELNVFGTHIAKLKKGDPFVFKTSGIDKEYKGYIKLISQRVNQDSKTVNVHGHFHDKEGVLKAGMFLNAEVLLGGSEVFAVPEQAVIENEDKIYVFMAKSNDEFVPLEVTLGNSDNGYVEIKTIQGNFFNIEVVTEGSHFLKGVFLAQSGGMDHGHAH